MSILMYEHHTLSTKLNFEECMLRLEKTIGQQGCIKEFIYGTTPYYGKIFERGIQSSATFVNGQILPGDNGCKIDFEISQNNSGRIPAMISSAVAGILLLACFIFFIEGSITANEADKSIGFFGMVLIAILYLISWISFKIEAITCRNDFYELFGVEVEI
jgi:hypothetical protein